MFFFFHVINEIYSTVSQKNNKFCMSRILWHLYVDVSYFFLETCWMKRWVRECGNGIKMSVYINIATAPSISGGSALSPLPAGKKNYIILDWLVFSILKKYVENLIWKSQEFGFNKIRVLIYPQYFHNKSYMINYYWFFFDNKLTHTG